MTAVATPDLGVRRVMAARARAVFSSAGVDISPAASFDATGKLQEQATKNRNRSNGKISWQQAVADAVASNRADWAKEYGEATAEALAAALNASDVIVRAPIKRGPLLGELKSGRQVHDRLKGSHFETHAKAQPELAAVLTEALSRIDPNGRAFLVAEAQMGHVVGNTSMVKTTANDDIVFAQRPNRKGLTRFARGRDGEPTESVTVVLQEREGAYDLISAWVGRPAAPEPWDKRADPETSIAFWSSHALVWGSEEVVPGTETTLPPPQLQP